MARLISRNMTATDSPLEVNSGSDSCLNCVSVCRRSEETQVTPHHNFLGRLGQGCSLLFGRIGWTDQLQRESS